MRLVIMLSNKASCPKSNSIGRKVITIETSLAFEIQSLLI